MSRSSRNAVQAAAHKVAAVTLASTIGVFGSSQIAFAAGLSTDPGEQPVLEAPGKALVETPLAAGDDSPSAGPTGTALDASKDAPSEGDPADSASDDPKSDLTSDGAAPSPDAAVPEKGDKGSDPLSHSEEAAPDAFETMALAEASFADQVSDALAANSNAVVTLSASETLDAQVTIPAGKQLTIDLNGFTLSCTGGTPFLMGGDASTLTVIDSSAAKTGVLDTGGSTLLAQDSVQKANFNLISGHITCSNLGNANFVQFTLMGGSVSMSTRMNVSDPTRVDIQGTCSVTSSASNGAFRVNSGVVSVSSSARVSYTGASAIFDLNGGSVILGSGATASGNITATNGNIVLFEKRNSGATINNADIVCSAGHPVFTATGTGVEAKITFVSGTIPDSSMEDFLTDGAFVFHVPGGGFVVHDQAFINDECVGMCNGIYYYSEADFASATGDKVAFKLVEFTFDKTSLAGSSLAGKVERVHVMPDTRLVDVPLFKLDSAPAKDGYTFYWVRSSTGAKYTQSEVLNLPITASAQAYSFVGKYEANPVEPVDPVKCSVAFHWGAAYVGDAGADATDRKLEVRSVEQGKALSGLLPSDAQVAVPGYRFLGWYDAAGNKLNASAPVQADTVYTARYERVGSGPTGPVGPGTNPGTTDPAGPGGPGEALVPNPGAGSQGSGAGGSGAGVMPIGSRTPRVPAPSSGWLPADLAQAAGFTVPASGPGVIVLDEFGEPVVAGAGAGDGDGAAADADGISLFDADSMDGSALPFSGADVARTLALVGGVALAGLLAARVGAFMAANAAVTRTRRRKALGLD